MKTTYVLTWISVCGFITYLFYNATAQDSFEKFVVSFFFACILTHLTFRFIVNPLIKNEIQGKNNQERIVRTTLPLSGTILGPAFALPKDFRVVYSGAKSSPIVRYRHDGRGKIVSIIIDFGNGKAGIQYGTSTITGVCDGLTVSIKSAQGNISL